MNLRKELIMRLRVLHLLVILASTKYLNPQTTAAKCCSVKIVSGKGVLDDTYNLVKEDEDKPEDVCLDGCIYQRKSELDEVYCFKEETDENASGSVSCEKTTVTSATDGAVTDSLEQLESQKAELEKEQRLAEQELDSQLAEEATLSDAEAKVNETETFVDNLLNGARKRQAASSCSDIGNFIDEMKEAVEKGDILGMIRAAVKIMTSGVTKCSGADKEVIMRKKVKIKDCRGRVKERILEVKIKIQTQREKIEKIKEKKQSILLAISLKPTKPPKPEIGNSDSTENSPIAFGTKPPSISDEPGKVTLKSTKSPQENGVGSAPIESTPIAFGSKTPNTNYASTKAPLIGTIFSKPDDVSIGQTQSTPVAFGSKPPKPSGTQIQSTAVTNKPIGESTNSVESTPISFGSKTSKPLAETKGPPTGTTFSKPDDVSVGQTQSTPIAFGSKPPKPSGIQIQSTAVTNKPIGESTNSVESTPISFGSKTSKPLPETDSPKSTANPSKTAEVSRFPSKTTETTDILEESTPIAFSSKDSTASNVATASLSSYGSKSSKPDSKTETTNPAVTVLLIENTPIAFGTKSNTLTSKPTENVLENTPLAFGNKLASRQENSPVAFGSKASFMI